MKATAANRLWAPLLLVTALLVSGAARASAQATCPVDPHWDHYKLYVARPPYPQSNLFVLLADQFNPAQPYQHQVLQLDYWMNPVEKTVLNPLGNITFPINTPFLHYSWWRISPQFNEKLVALCNQFGDQTLYVKDAQYLLNPALKNQSGSPPPFNHYKCYACEGQPVNRQVTLRDQFDPVGTQGWTATVTYPRWFCNPAMKQVLGSPLPPNQIVDGNQHYVCYEYTPADTRISSLSFTDQFIPSGTLDVGPSQWLCVPTFKTGFTPTTRGTWGKLKTLYR